MHQGKASAQGHHLVREKLDRTDPRGSLLRQWPTSDGRPWVEP